VKVVFQLRCKEVKLKSSDKFPRDNILMIESISPVSYKFHDKKLVQMDFVLTVLQPVQKYVNMKNSDLDKMSEAERHQYLSSLPLEELLKRAGASKIYEHEDGPAWKSVNDKQCHICHKPISDEASLRVKIGASDCRPRIELELKHGPEMWDQASTDELEIIWTTFNVYGIYISDVAHKVNQVYRKDDLTVFELQDTSDVLVKKGSQMMFSSREAARNMWKDA
jgi:hypothetical protein